MRHRRTAQIAPACVLAASFGACGVTPAPTDDQPIETGFAFTNFSTRFYAALRIRPHVAGGADTPLARTRLLPPGATERLRFLAETGDACPDTIDVQVFLYQRVNEAVPIGLDDTEAVATTPVAAGELRDVPACGTQPLETYTIVNWDAEPGTARVKLAQATPVDDAIRATGLFHNPDAAWEISGVSESLAGDPPPPLAESEPISGRVVRADGTGVEGVGVLLRTRFRVRLDDGDPANDPDAGYSAPIALTQTDSSGAFSFDRPAGAYRVEVFSDDWAFRPAAADLETPSATVLIVAEPL